MPRVIVPALRYGAGAAIGFAVPASAIGLVGVLIVPHPGQHSLMTEVLIITAIIAVAATGLFALGGLLFRCPLTTDGTLTIGAGSVALQVLLLIPLAIFGLMPQGGAGQIAIPVLLSLIYFFAPLMWRSK